MLTPNKVKLSGQKITNEELFYNYKLVYLRLIRYWSQQKSDPEAVKKINQLKSDYEKVKTKLQ